MEYYGDFETWAHDVGEDKVFSVQLLKEKFTPEEEANKYTDESIYEEVHEYAIIKEIIPLGEEGKIYDYLIGFEEVWIDCEVVDGTYQYNVKSFDEIKYYRLSQILLTDVTKRWKRELLENE